MLYNVGWRTVSHELQRYENKKCEKTLCMVSPNFLSKNAGFASYQILLLLVSKTIGVCAKHWPQGCKSIKIQGGADRPTNPPPIFGTTNLLCFSQSIISRNRDVKIRAVTAESRAAKNDLRDKIDSVRDLINESSNALAKCSQIDAIIVRLNDTPKDIQSETRFMGNNLMSLCDEDNEKRQRQLNFIGKQLIPLDAGPHGRRYSAESTTAAINLYLGSKSTYRALRELLVLPCRNTIYEYFGKLGLAGTLDECNKTVKRVFESINEGQRNSFISFDEIHIKPGLHGSTNRRTCVRENI